MFYLVSCLPSAASELLTRTPTVPPAMLYIINFEQSKLSDTLGMTKSKAGCVTHFVRLLWMR